jgi:Protein of unknown function (DUF1572)
MNSTPDESARLSSSFLAQAREQLAANHRLIRHCVAQLDDQRVWWRPHESQNSIGNLLLHVTGNLRERLLAIVAGQSHERQRAAEFAERAVIAKDVLLGRLEAVVALCEQVLDGLVSAQLLALRSYQGLNQRFDLDVLSVIFRTLLHLAGHAQEIVFMTRLQLGEAYRFANPTPRPR